MGAAHISPSDLQAQTDTFFEGLGVFKFTVEATSDTGATIRLPFSPLYLRPGKAIAGPVLMAVADFGIFTAIGAFNGAIREAVTQSLNFNFLDRAEPGDLIVTSTILKSGKRIVVGECDIRTENMDKPAALARGSFVYL